MRSWWGQPVEGVRMWFLARLAVLCGALAAVAVEAGLFVYVSKVLAVIVGVCAFMVLVKLFDAVAAGEFRVVVVFLLLVAIFVLAPSALYDAILVKYGVQVEATVISDWYLTLGTGDDEAPGQDHTIRVRQCVVRVPDGRTHPKRINDCHTAIGDRIPLLVDPDLKLIPSASPRSQLSSSPRLLLIITGLFALIFLFGKPD